MQNVILRSCPGSSSRGHCLAIMTFLLGCFHRYQSDVVVGGSIPSENLYDGLRLDSLRVEADLAFLKTIDDILDERGMQAYSTLSKELPQLIFIESANEHKSVAPSHDAPPSMICSKIIILNNINNS